MGTPEASDIRFGLEVSTGFVVRALMSAIGFVGTIVFARLLDPSLFGGYYLLLSVVTIAVQPIDGFATAAKKRFSETSGFREEILGGQLVIIGVLGAVATVVSSLFAGRLASYSGLEQAAVLFSLLLVTVSFVESVMTVVEGTGRVSLSNLVDLVGSVFTFPTQLAFVLLGYGAAGMAFGLTIASALTGLIGLVVLGVRPKRPSKQTFCSIWAFGRFSATSRLLSKIITRTDIILLGIFLTPVVAGQYEVAWKLSMPAALVGIVAGNGLMARVSNFHSKGRLDRIRIDLKNTLSVSAVVAVPMVFGALALPEELVVTIYGAEYRDAAQFLPLVILYQLVRKQADQLFATTQGFDRPDVPLVINGAMLVVKLTLAIGLFSVGGAVGVVYAAIATELLRYLAGGYAVRQLVDDVRLVPRALVEQIVAGAVMYPFVVVLNARYPVRSWVDLLLLVGSGALAYGVVLMGISDTHRSIAASVFGQFKEALAERQ